MKKIGLAIISIIILVIVLIQYSNFGKTKIIDWEESYDEKSTQPYGTYVLYKELSNLFETQKIRTVYYDPTTYLTANSEDGNGEHIAKGIYLLIGNSNYLDSYDIKTILRFTNEGNTLFISDYHLHQKLADTLGLETQYYANGTDSISTYTLKNKFLFKEEIQLDKNEGDIVFKTDTALKQYEILGYAKQNDTLKPNVIRIDHGLGQIILHLEPKVFTNYHLLKEKRYKYAEAVLSYLPNDNVYFDSYDKIYNTTYGNTKQESNLKWFLQQNAFKWAWYLSLFFAFIFILFNAKRRQRIIKIIKPIENTTVGFVKTISNLYFETQDHKNIITKKITYFLEKLRTDYNIDTSVLDDEFIEKLTAKSGQNKDVVAKVIKHINWLNSKTDFFEENLVHLNRYIEAFYSK
ncbi:MAG: DUF4350 domain-containing protein [Flavobacteriaceae bacterium]|nr:DUF4350 domain-containing protein [Flavobacteriaceae bacterium]